MNLDDIIARVAFHDLDKVRNSPALRLRVGRSEEHRDITFGELHQFVVLRAGALAACGCLPGERVALLMPHSERLVTTFLGALYGGMIPSILAWPTAKMDPEKYRRNVTAVVSSLGADWLVTDQPTAVSLGTALGQTRVVDPASIDRAGLRFDPDPRRDGPAFVQFSGGTTGTQKSVPISFDLLRHQLNGYARVLSLAPSDHIISWLPLYHDMGLVACLLLPFIFRLPVTMFAPMEWVMDPAPFLRAIGDHRATHCWLPNFAFAFMASRVQIGPWKIDLSSLRAAINCSEPVRAESMDAFAARFEPYGLRRSALHCCYAMAETTFATTQTSDTDPPRRMSISRTAFGLGRLEHEEESPRKVVSCGRAIPGMEIRVVDAKGEECVEACIGEIWINGTSVMDDYLTTPGRARLTKREVFTEGWYRTGDMGAIVDGHLYITGRRKDIVIIGGVNIYPEDLESAVAAVPGIHPGRVVAMGLPDEKLGTDRLVVVAEMNVKSELSQAQSLEVEVRRTVWETCGVAPFRVFVVPPHWIVKSTAGKISRSETRTRVENRWSELISRRPGECAQGPSE